MSSRMQSTILYKFFSEFIRRLAYWSVDPWRRYSFLLIVFFVGFLLGSSLGMINGVLALMDPIGALIAVLFLEGLIVLRPILKKYSQPLILIYLCDAFRIGVLYGLFTEASKLL